MVKKPDPVEFRMPCDPPTKPGWYYAYVVDSVDQYIHPVEVCVWSSGFMSTVYPNQDGNPARYSDYVWYGPVREVKHGSGDRL